MFTMSPVLVQHFNISSIYLYQQSLTTPEIHVSLCHCLSLWCFNAGTFVCVLQYVCASHHSLRALLFVCGAAVVRVALWGGGGSVRGGRPPLLFYLPTQQKIQFSQFEMFMQQLFSAWFHPLTQQKIILTSITALYCSFWENSLGKSKEHGDKSVNVFNLFQQPLTFSVFNLPLLQ